MEWFKKLITTADPEMEELKRTLAVKTLQLKIATTDEQIRKMNTKTNINAADTIQSRKLPFNPK